MDLALGLLDLHDLAELGRLRGLALADCFGVGSKMRSTLSGKCVSPWRMQLRDVAERHGRNVVDVVQGSCAGEAARPDRLLRAVAKKEVDLAWSVDRLGRSPVHLLARRQARAFVSWILLVETSNLDDRHAA